ncbi:MAG: hypothetical protein F6K62_19250 [Sphaerospermopsis sp. SIO1G2]|nr:hypothetical protein [Sphaerospermopsis sp. SIO1G1]NET72985.1 hypothetical protein [Sphaerospermopsis sp. SIO1G2]
MARRVFLILNACHTGVSINTSNSNILSAFNVDLSWNTDNKMTEFQELFNGTEEPRLLFFSGHGHNDVDEMKQKFYYDLVNFTFYKERFGERYIAFKKLDPIQVMVDPNLIMETLLNQELCAKNGEILFDIIESDRVQAYLTELGLEKIRFCVKDLKGDVIAEKIVSDLLEVFQIYPYFEAGSVYISHDTQNSDNNSHLVLSVNEFYQRYLLEKTL